MSLSAVIWPQFSVERFKL